MNDRSLPLSAVILRTSGRDEVAALSRRGPMAGAAVLAACVLVSADLGDAQLPVSPPTEKAHGTSLQPQPESGDSPGINLEELKTKRKAAEAALKAVDRPTSLAAGAPRDAAREQLLERRALLQQIVRGYDEQIDEVRRTTDALQRRREAEQANVEWTGFSEPPPYSIVMTDALWDAVSSLESTVEGIESQLALMQMRFDRARQAVTTADERLRQAAEQVETRPDAPSARWDHELARLRQQAAAIMVHAADASRRRVEEELAEAKVRLGLARRQLKAAEEATHFTQADVDAVTNGLSRERRALEEELQQAIKVRHARSQALIAAPQRRSSRASGVGGTATGPQAQGPDAERAATVARTHYETAARHVDLLRQLIDIVDGERHMWQRRLAVVHGGEPGQAKDAYAAFQHLSQNVDGAREYLRQQLVVNSSTIGEYESRLATARPPERDVLRAMIDIHRQRDAFYSRVLQRMDRTARFLARWDAQFKEQGKTVPLTTRLSAWGRDAGGAITRVWNLELLTAEDTIEVDGKQMTGRRSITIGKVLTALGILLVGYWACLFLARIVARVAAARLGIAPDVESLVRQWLQAFLIMILIVTSLLMVKIPLTVFAFLGGAFAIGVGFGAQTLLKNVISGILLLLERPLRVGDLIEVDSIRGRVTSIGLRSSTVRDAQGIETLIPNSHLLERHLTNWTYSNHATRFSLRMAVPYGQPAEEIRTLLLDLAKQHPRVLPLPSAQVLLEDFGDKTRTFVLNYWLQLRSDVDAAEVASELRFMIERRFMEVGLKVHAA